jgi:hypothetical protein
MRSSSDAAPRALLLPQRVGGHTLLVVVNCYDWPFRIGFAAQQKMDSVNFLNSL